MGGYKVVINFIVFNQPLGNTRQQRGITADLDLNDIIDHIVALTCCHMGGFLRVSKFTQTLFTHGVYRDNAAALLVSMGEHFKHARVIGRRVLPKH